MHLTAGLLQALWAAATCLCCLLVVAVLVPYLGKILLHPLSLEAVDLADVAQHNPSCARRQHANSQVGGFPAEPAMQLLNATDTSGLTLCTSHQTALCHILVPRSDASLSKLPRQSGRMQS